VPWTFAQLVLMSNEHSAKASLSICDAVIVAESGSESLPNNGEHVGRSRLPPPPTPRRNVTFRGCGERGVGEYCSCCWCGKSRTDVEEDSAPSATAWPDFWRKGRRGEEDDDDDGDSDRGKDDVEEWRSSMPCPSRCDSIRSMSSLLGCRRGRVGAVTCKRGDKSCLT
jgi:hypothetical protein